MPSYTHKMANVGYRDRRFCDVISPYVYSGARLAKTPQQRRMVFTMLQTSTFSQSPRE